MKVLILDPMESTRKVLETLIEGCLAKDGEQADVVHHTPEDVFRLPLPGIRLPRSSL